LFHYIHFLDQLDKASGEEKEKMLSLLNALQSPSNQDKINSYRLSTEQHKEETMTLPTPVQVQEEVLIASTTGTQHAEMPFKEDNSIEMMKKLADDVFDPTEENATVSKIFRRSTKYYFNNNFISDTYYIDTNQRFYNYNVHIISHNSKNFKVKIYKTKTLKNLFNS